MSKEVVPKLGRWMYKNKAETVQQFVSRLPPSRTSFEVTPWICAHHEHEAWDPPPISPIMQKEFDKRVTIELLQKDDKREHKHIDMESLLPLFRKHGYVLGKWVIIVERDAVDEVWETVLNKMYSEGLGCGIAKVSPATPESDVHVVCIYSLDFQNTWDVKRVATQIRHLGLTDVLKYKPEAATQLDLYCENERWGERATTVYVNIRDRSNVSLTRRAWDTRRQALFHMLEDNVFRQA